MSGLFGSSTKNSGQQNAAIGNLNNVFNTGIGQNTALSTTGSATTNAGVAGLGASQNYFQNLMSGNRSAIQQAQAPETNAVLSGADAARRQQAASGTARGGGTAAGNQQAGTNTAATLDNAIFSARPQAAAANAQVSGTEANVGNTEMSQALQALGLAGETQSAAGTIATDARQEAQTATQNSIKDLFQWMGLPS